MWPDGEPLFAQPNLATEIVYMICLTIEQELKKMRRAKELSDG